MKFIRFGERGAEKPGVLDGEGRLRDLSGVVPDLAGAVLGDLPQVDPETLPLVEGEPRIGVPVGQIGKLVAIGLNFSDHAAELDTEPPEMPIVFMKANSCINGPFDPVILPRVSQKADWEVELGVVIGKTAKYVSEAEAMDHVAGFTIVNDVSEREFQMEWGGQWTKGKSCDTFGPIGPWLVTPDEVGDVNALDMALDVNGERMQTGNTSYMIFKVPHIIAHLSQIMTLHPGDVIATGTPPGVGMGHKPQKFLKEGDVMSASIEKLGAQRQRIMRDA
jgi:2-keto-4-pentenoate hydratase/2-oxohepta-3-ene-1,7-dioic acid hydratase in catechol pathway